MLSVDSAFSKLSVLEPQALSAVSEAAFVTSALGQDQMNDLELGVGLTFCLD